MRLGFLVEGVGYPRLLYHYTSALSAICRSGRIRGPVSMSEVLGIGFAGSLKRQGVNDWFALEVRSGGLDLVPFVYDKRWAGAAYDDVLDSWVDEREWVCEGDVPLGCVSRCFVNPSTAAMACEYLSEASLRRLLGTEVGDVARVWLGVVDPGSVRPSVGDSFALLCKHCELVSGLDVVVMPD